MTPSERGKPLPLAGGDDLIEQTKDGGSPPCPSPFRFRLISGHLTPMVIGSGKPSNSYPRS